MELPVINIYCDESCHLENDKHTSMVLGGVSCPISKVRDISVKIKELKEKYGMPKYREIKWVKVSQGKADFYHELIDVFLTNECLRFRAVKVKDKSCLSHAKFHQTHNEWYYKMYYTMLRQVIQPYKNYNIYMDIKDTVGGERVAKLKEFLNNLNPNKNTSEILKIQQIRSFESEIIQLADILIGAVGYQDRLPEIKTAPNATKLSLCKKIEEDLQINFNSKTPYLNTKFNLLIWEGQQ